MLWDTRRKNSQSDNVAVEEELGSIGIKLEKLVDRLLEANSSTLINTYEKSIQNLEKQKIILGEKRKNCLKSLQRFETAFKTAHVWLSNLAVLWDTGCLEDRIYCLK